MTAKAVKNDRIKPTTAQIAKFNARRRELESRFLKGTLDSEAVIAGLQPLMEMTRGRINCSVQPEIPNWADRQSPIIQHIPCDMIDPSKLTTPTVFTDTDGCVLDGEEFITRAQKLPGSMNACAFDFFSKPENWKYLPADVDVIVFPKTLFRGSSGSRCVRYLYRSGAGWVRYYRWLGDGFDRGCRVAALASPLPSTT